MRKKGKTVSFDAMVKFFMQNYNIPTTKDFDKVIARMDRLEKMVKTSSYGKNRRYARGIAAGALGRPAMSASDMVLEIITKFKQGVDFTEIQARTGFEEKKLRNIIYRLTKLGKITRKSRGIYVGSASSSSAPEEE
ncbi:MAG: hypothetical protein PHP23_09535 [Desulfobacterales bacterium]|nr:hypothetical protein [Desulfobacterales bacterium]MDD4071432.1 hypothetical protein [Desulfobacterales bacterium]MDD4392046.1 hypothetical protein [Desulfobacterales bacterium]